MIVNAEVDTLIESNLGTMIINDTDEEDSAAADSSETMKRWFLIHCLVVFLLHCLYSIPATFNIDFLKNLL